MAEPYIMTDVDLPPLQQAAEEAAAHLCCINGHERAGAQLKIAFLQGFASVSKSGKVKYVP